MKKSFLIAGAAVLAIAVPAIAAHHEGGDHAAHKMMKDMTRADVEAKVKDHFAMVDANKDGAITQDEIKARHEAMRAERKDAHFKKMDTNSDGSINRAEFDAAHSGMRDGKGWSRGKGDGDHKMGHRGHGMAMKMGGKMFEKADANKDGKVTLAEATSTALTHFDQVDADKNGTVTAAERMEYWKAKKAEWQAKKSAS
tara:strand:+ start:637 stop:1230 length:594 start_codon:yes stop_codon:yes gene_type:complete